MVDTDNSQLPGDRKGGVTHVLDLPIKQGLRRIKGHRVTSVNANWIHVFNH